VVNANTVFDDNGCITRGERLICNHDNLRPGRVNMVDVLRLSLNVEAAKMAEMMGARVFYNYVLNFGFGRTTGVDLASEAAGLVKVPGDGYWYPSDLAMNAFGQGLSATPLQMANAVAAVANGGQLMKPYVVSKIVYPGGRIELKRPQSVRQVIRPEIARLTTQLLAQAIVGESDNKAVVTGYAIAGKTGTAQIPVPGGYDERWTIASFAGFLPADDPRFVLLVKLDKPTHSPWGSQEASPVFAAVAKQIVALAGLPPDGIRLGK
jgi:cell division protein FtsI/penicillin-binding protein 2